MELTKQNYFSVDANMEYMGATQFKDFMKCESEGLAKANGVISYKKLFNKVEESEQ